MKDVGLSTTQRRVEGRQVRSDALGTKKGQNLREIYVNNCRFIVVHYKTKMNLANSETAKYCQPKIPLESPLHWGLIVS